MIKNPIMNAEEFLEKVRKNDEESINKQIDYINSQLEIGLSKSTNGVVSLGNFVIRNDVREIFENYGYKFERKRSGINENYILIMPKGVDYHEN